MEELQPTATLRYLRVRRKRSDLRLWPESEATAEQPHRVAIAADEPVTVVRGRLGGEYGNPGLDKVNRKNATCDHDGEIAARPGGRNRHIAADRRNEPPLRAPTPVSWTAAGAQVGGLPSLVLESPQKPLPTPHMRFLT
jgi:hypothetical protein